jgi:RNase P/RNase MRP subunit p29
MNKMKCLLLTAALLAAVQLAGAQGQIAAATADASAGFSGKVVETTNTAGYTYVRVDTGSQKLWAATTQFDVKTGDSVTVAAGAPMANYHSQSLDRTFDLVYFTGGITVNSGTAAAATAPVLPAGHPPLTGTAPAAKIDLTGIPRAEGGKTIAEIYAGRAKLAGQPVTVRGKVVKYNAMIMGKNWLHIRDGSGSADTRDNDLAVTTSTAAKLGDTVLVSGVVTTNKDFGAGYKYAVILDDAKVTVE